MPAGTAQLTLSNGPLTLRGYFRAWFIAMTQRVRAQRQAAAEQRRAATVAATERDATRLYWRD
jgi:hypothetical protein